MRLAAPPPAISTGNGRNLLDRQDAQTIDCPMKV
jgi:hypothetical protein